MVNGETGGMADAMGETTREVVCEEWRQVSNLHTCRG